MCCMWRSLSLWWGQITFALQVQVIFCHHNLSDHLTQLIRLCCFFIKTIAELIVEVEWAMFKVPTIALSFLTNPFPAPTIRCACIDTKIRMFAWLSVHVSVASTFDSYLLIHSYSNSPYIFKIICSFICIFKSIWFINNIQKVCGAVGVVWHHKCDNFATAQKIFVL